MDAETHIPTFKHSKNLFFRFHFLNSTGLRFFSSWLLSRISVEKRWVIWGEMKPWGCSGSLCFARGCLKLLGVARGCIVCKNNVNIKKQKNNGTILHSNTMINYILNPEASSSNPRHTPNNPEQQRATLSNNEQPEVTPGNPGQPLRLNLTVWLFSFATLQDDVIQKVFKIILFWKKFKKDYEITFYNISVKGSL